MEDEDDDGEGIEEEDDVDVAGWTRRSLDRGRGRCDEGSTSMTARGVKVIAGRRGGDGPFEKEWARILSAIIIGRRQVACAA